MNPACSVPRTILFSGHDFRFLRPFIDYCDSQPNCRVLLDLHGGHALDDSSRCRELLTAADVIFCEWALGNAVWYSHHKASHQRLLVRLHLQEMRLPFLEQIDWNHVDQLILICPLNYHLIRDRFPFLRNKTQLVFNPINCDAFDQPKLPGAEFNLGLLGISPMRKAPHLAFELLTRLKAIDSRYTLFVKGKHPSEHDWLWQRREERNYYQWFYDNIERSPYTNSVVFEPYGADIPDWFSKIGFILSTSDFEGSHQSVAEGMASGAIPVIRNWLGADLLYPRQFIFASVSQAVDSITTSREPGNYERVKELAKAYARTQFDECRINIDLQKLCHVQG